MSENEIQILTKQRDHYCREANLYARESVLFANDAKMWKGDARKLCKLSNDLIDALATMDFAEGTRIRACIERLNMAISVLDLCIADEE
jgi:hypothetical protein